MPRKTDADKSLLNLCSRYIERKISRRDFMRRAAALGVSTLSASALIEALSGTAAAADNPIVTENQQPGSNGWQVSLTPATDVGGQIKGYASATSVNKGQSITFYISVNPAQTYTIDVYRMGWYQGLGGRFLQHIGPFNGVQQPAPTLDSVTGLLTCNWAPAYVLTVPTTWTSGIYLALLTNAQNYQSYIIFVVRDDSRVAPLLYQQSITTYHAYNNYPDDGKTGKSLYDHNSYGANTIAGTPRAVKVTFDRPITSSYWQGSGDYLSWEAYFVRWMERSGYDVTYSTNVDTHASGSRLLNCKGFLSVGHDEYWSKAMRDAAEAARDAGVNLAFFGADAAYWQIRFEASASGVPNRVIVCYKDATKDPVQGPTTTVQFRSALVNRPEQSLMGVQFTSQTLNNTYLNYVVINSSNWVYAGTGFNEGDSVTGIVGYETDHRWTTFPPPNSVPGTYTLLSTSPYTNYNNASDWANSSIYQAPSSAWVFAAGTIAWSWGLDNGGSHGVPDARIQQTTANILNKFVTSSPSGIAAPSNLTAAAAPGLTVNLAWKDNSNNEDNFVIESSTDQLTWSVVNASLPANSTSYTDTVAADGVYYYRVRATATTGGSYSNTAGVDTQLLSPTDLSASSTTSGYRVDLTWSDHATDESAYTVERSPDGSANWTILNSSLGPNATSYSDASVMPITRYYYRVKATNSIGSSSYSNIASVTTINDTPRAPSNLSESRTGNPQNQTINLTWTDNSNNETSFVIERSTTSNFASGVVTMNVGANITSYSDRALARQTTYYYRVKAVNAIGQSSPYSNVVSDKTR